MLETRHTEKVIEVNLSPRRTFRFLLLVVLGLILASLVGQFTNYFQVAYPLDYQFTRLFDVDGEQNIPSLYSASALLLCSILLATITYAKKVAGDSYVRYWQTLSIIFFFLSLDEALSLHEVLTEPLQSALNTSGFLYFAWVIPGFIFVLICLLAFWRFLAALPAKTRRLFLIAGSIFVGGAIGTELVGGYQTNLYGRENITYVLLATIEELFEMLGIVVFIYALLSYLSSYMKGVVLQAHIMDDRKRNKRAE